MLEHLSGRKAVVIGAASGIGRAHALALAGLGMEIVAVDLNAEALESVALEIKARGVAVRTRTVDVSDAAAVQDLARDVDAEGPVSVLVNSAGVAVAGDFMETPEEDWAWVVGVNLLGVVHGCRAFGPSLIRAPGRSHLVNIASASAFGGVPGLSAYSTTKAAVLSLSESLEAELDPASVAVHCVCPGFVRTGLLDRARFGGYDDEEARDAAKKALFQEGRTPEDVAVQTLRAMRGRRFLVPVFSEGHVAAWARHLPQGLLGSLRRSVSRRLKQRVEAEGAAS